VFDPWLQPALAIFERQRVDRICGKHAKKFFARLMIV
jgi:hypothetical protein